MPHGTDGVAATVSRLVELQSIRVFCIKGQSRCDRSIESLIARFLGYHNGLEEKERKELYRRAGVIRKSVENGDGDQPVDETHVARLPVAIHPTILASAKARAVWDEIRKPAEKEMERLAKTLPVWPWAEDVRGLGGRTLGMTVGEAGIPVGEYRTVCGLWSRFGLGVIGGIPQRRTKNKELAKLLKFPPRRRAEIWVVANSLLRGQWRGADEETGTPAQPIGPYGEVYGARREITHQYMVQTSHLPNDDPGKWTAKRCDADARRIMTKAFLKDLWVEWRASS